MIKTLYILAIYPVTGAQESRQRDPLINMQMACFVVPCYSTQLFIAPMLMKQHGGMQLNKTHKSSRNHWIW